MNQNTTPEEPESPNTSNDIQEITQRVLELLQEAKGRISADDKKSVLDKLINGLETNENIDIHLPTALFALHQWSEEDKLSLEEQIADLKEVQSNYEREFEVYKDEERLKGKKAIDDALEDVANIEKYKREKEQELTSHKSTMERFSLYMLLALVILIGLFILPMIPGTKFLQTDPVSNIINKLGIILPFLAIVYHLHERYKTSKSYFEREKEVHGMIDGKILVIQSLKTSGEDKRKAMKSISDIIINTKDHWPQEKSSDPLSQSVEKFSEVLDSLTNLLRQAKKESKESEE